MRSYIAPLRGSPILGAVVGSTPPMLYIYKGAKGQRHEPNSRVGAGCAITGDTQIQAQPTTHG